MKIQTRRQGRRTGADDWLRRLRASFVVTAISISLLLVYWPSYPPSANAETAAASLSPGPSVAVTPEPAADPSPEATAEPTEAPPVDPTDPPSSEPSPDPTEPGEPLPSVEPPPESSPGPSPSAPASLAGVTVALSADGIDSEPAVVSPGARVVLTASINATSLLAGARLVVAVPAGWSLRDTDGGDHDDSLGTVSWDLPAIDAATEQRQLLVEAPQDASADAAAPEQVFEVRVELGDDSLAGEPLVLIVAPPVTILSVSEGRIDTVGGSPAYLDAGVALRDQQRFEVFRLRFEVANSGAVAHELPVLLEYATDASGAAFKSVPAGEAVPGHAFYAAEEWIRLPGGGTAIGPAFVDEPATADEARVVRSSGLNPMPSISLAPASVTMIEFSVRATVNADYEAGYRFRLADTDDAWVDGPQASVIMGERPAVVLSPGQQTGKAADGPSSATRLLTSSSTSTPHSPTYDLATDACAACHRAHTAQASMLGTAPTEYALCVSCHNGVNAPDVETAYATAPDNDPASRAYYQHDPTQVVGPVGTANACSDCHNPHNSVSTRPTMTTAGWTASGRIYAASGVEVTNGPGAVTYALVNQVSLEYELCFKCHSGAGQLPSNDGQPPSRMALDKGIEFDPRIPSYHPIEAAGTNSSSQLQASLDGTSAYKRWDFDTADTIRCVNCHADSRDSARTAEGILKPPDTSLLIHASAERGILIEPYRDRVLMGATEPYEDVNFALCFVCHAEAPFRDTSGEERSDTNFRYHGLHVSAEDLQDHGNPGTSIDTPGDGAGLATCAECHFRIHSTAYTVDGQAPGPRLVNFAPNVTGRTGVPLSWQVKTSQQPGTCSLRCHGEPHTEIY